MKTLQPDIIVTSPDGEYLMVVEAQPSNSGILTQSAVEQFKSTMTSIGCSVGLLIFGEQVILLRDSFNRASGESISVIGEAALPDALLPPADKRWQGEPAFEFEERVQRWLEKLKLSSSMESLPKDLRSLLEEQVIYLLRFGEVRSAGPRWSRAAK
jgi:hypothetical protein